MKTILVPTAGSATDETVFKTALAVAKPLDAHLAFVHVRVAPAEAIAYLPHAGFARGRALRACFDNLAQHAEEHSRAAELGFRRFCTEQHVPVVATPHPNAPLSASWSEEINAAPERLLHRARHCDLVVVGRQHHADDLPPDFLDRLLLDCGRPLLIAPAGPPRALLGTVMVCWNDTAASARVLTAAMPLLRRATRVLIATVAEQDDDAGTSAQELAQRLAWSGLAAEAVTAARTGNAVWDVLRALARERAVDLVVMGGYSHRPLREMMFGGCTRAFLEQADLPVFMLH